MAGFNQPEWAAFMDTEAEGALVAVLSAPRLRPFGLGEAGCSRREAIVRHAGNMQRSEALYPLLHMLEIVMRNRIHAGFSAWAGRDDWFDAAWLWPGHAGLVADAKAAIASRRRPVDPDRVVAELGFGFWCGMFHRSYESGSGPWPGLLPVVLPRVPKSWRTREKLRQRVEEARRTRNRVFHHEPLAIGVPDHAVLAHHRAIIELLGWFSPEARALVEQVCRFRAVVAATSAEVAHRPMA